MAPIYTPRTFALPTLRGISDKQIQAHLKLYEGYVTHTNTIMSTIERLLARNQGKNDFIVRELWRRFGFEFDGMRSHEYYFGALEHGSVPLTPTHEIGQALALQYGSLEGFYKSLIFTTATRGSGWVLLSFDPVVQKFIIGWVDEHHLGHLSSLPIILALDCWEHAYMVDHDPTGRRAYVDAYLENINWDTVNGIFKKVSSA